MKPDVSRKLSQKLSRMSDTLRYSNSICYCLVKIKDHASDHPDLIYTLIMT